MVRKRGSGKMEGGSWKKESAFLRRLNRKKGVRTKCRKQMGVHLSVIRFSTSPQTLQF